MHFYQNEQFILKIYRCKKFFKQESVYFVLRSQDSLQDFSYELI
jgi:hypothetical protein